MKFFQQITKTIWFISLVSLFTDFASEMLYPVMPVYLKSIGYSVLVIGILEGFAEAGRPRAVPADARDRRCRSDAHRLQLVLWRSASAR